MKKRLFAVLMCVMMAMALLPATAFAANATSVWIWGKELTGTTPYYHNGANGVPGTVDNDDDGYNAYFNAANGTLTLKGLNVRSSTATRTITTSSGDETFTYAIFAEGDLTINVTENSAVSTGAATAGNTNVALGVIGDATFTGSARLNATAGTGNNTEGVHISGDLTVSSGTLSGATGAAGNAAITNATNFGVKTMGTLTVSGGTLAGTGSTATAVGSSISAGIGANAVTVSGGSLTAIGNTATAKYALSYGLYVMSLDIQAGETYAQGSTATGGSQGGFSAGVAARNFLSVSGGSLTVKGGKATATGGANAQSSGIYAEANSFSFSGGTVEATGGESGMNSCGITNTGGMSVSGTADVKATGGTAAAEQSFGVFVMGNITANGGSITGMGGEAKTLSSYGVYTQAGSIETNGGTIKGTGGKAKYRSFGTSAFDTQNGKIIVNGGSITGIGGQGDTYGGIGIETYALDVLSGRLVGKTGEGGKALVKINPASRYPDPCYWRTSESAKYTTGTPSSGFLAGKTYVDIDSNLPTPSIKVSDPAFGAGQAPRNDTVTIDSDININATNNFDSARMGDVQLDLGTVGNPGAHGSISDGSIIIRLHKAYLDTLPVGIYTLTVDLKGEYANRSVSATIRVNPAAAVPTTGDPAQPILWLMIALLAGAGLAVNVVIRRKRQNG